MEIINNLNWRYATKKFDGRIVNEADLNILLEAIRLSSSSLGAQPYHIVVASGEMKDKLIESSGQVDKKGCSHLLVFCTRTDYPKRADEQIKITAKIQGRNIEELAGFANMINGATSSRTKEQLNEWAARQAYIALGFGLVACAELKIDSCAMEGFSPEKFHEILGLPDYINPVVILPIGYRDPSDNTQPSQRAKMRFPKEDLFDFR